jgi:hypothetical protein
MFKSGGSELGSGSFHFDVKYKLFFGSNNNNNLVLNKKVFIGILLHLFFLDKPIFKS